MGLAEPVGGFRKQKTSAGVCEHKPGNITEKPLAAQFPVGERLITPYDNVQILTYRPDQGQKKPLAERRYRV